MEPNTEKPIFVSQKAIGSGVPRIQDPTYHFDESSHWVFQIPEDVQEYLKAQFGEDIEIGVQGNEPQRTSAGYCGYMVSRGGEYIGGIQLGGANYRAPDGRTGVVSEWKLFHRQDVKVGK